MGVSRANQTAPPAPTYDLDRFWLRFRDPEVERKFELESIAQSLGIIRIYVFAGTMLYVLFGALDFVMAGHALHAVLAIRYGFVFPILACVLGLTFLPTFPRYSQIALSVGMIASGLGIIAMTAIMPPPYNAQYYGGLFMVVIFCASLIRLRFFYSVLITIFLVSLYEISATIINPMPEATFIGNNFFLLVNAGVGMFSGYIQEGYLRRTYVNQKVIEAKNEDLNLLLLEADKANRSKGEFLTTMSHELRTPLNAIIGFSDILQKQSFGPLGDKRYEEYVQDINNSGSHLLAIINDILDLAKAEAGKLKLREEETDLVHCLQNCVQMCRGRADDGGIRLRLSSVPAEIYATVDERLILQLALNLISNAIKFTPFGGSVQIDLHADKLTGILIEVTDTGIGIPEEHIERVLRPFEQVESALSRQHGGTGLGLPFAKKIAELHDGSLAIESEVERGTHITVLLPATRLVRTRHARPARQAVGNS